MKLAGEYRFDAPRPVVWDTLLDPEVLAATLPGCERLDRDEATGQYSGDLKVKVGPVDGRFQAKVDLEDVVEPETYTMQIDGRGAPGFVRATAVITLVEDGESTVMRYDADAKVGGRIAGVGQRLVETSARSITKESLEGLHENVRRRAAHLRKKAEGVSERVDAREDEASSDAGESRAEEGASDDSGPEIHRVDESKVARAVAKDVARSLVPAPVLGIVLAAILALVAYLALS